MKPRQIFTLNFQNDIEGQLNDVTTKQLLKLCIHIMTLLPFNFLIMFEFEEEFESLKKIVDPNFQGLFGWRDSLCTYIKFHSKSAEKALYQIGANPAYMVSLLL